MLLLSAGMGIRPSRAIMETAFAVNLKVAFIDADQVARCPC